MLSISEIVVRGANTKMSVPRGSTLLQIGERRGYIVMWVMCDANTDAYDEVRVVVAKNGNDLDKLNIAGLAHKGTVVINDIPLHVFMQPY